MHFTDEELIAYLLGDAPPDTARQIEDQVSNDPALLERLKHFRAVLGVLDRLELDGLHLDGMHSDEEPGCRHEPPAGLVESTMARVFQDDATFQEDEITGDHFAGDHFNNDHPEPELADFMDADPLGRDSHRASHVGGRHAAAPRLSTAFDAPRGRRSLWDSTALTISLTILCCLALPALVRARFEARRAQCAENMRITGRGLLDFALNNPEQRFPGIAISGPLAFAGAYAMHLNNAGLLQSLEQLSCPSLGGRFEVTELASLGLAPQFVQQGSLRLPTEAEMLALPEHQLPIVQSVVGGSYAYGLGVREDDRPVPPRHEGRTHFAILADAPLFINGSESFVAHDGYGINILYDDGRVHFFSTARLQAARSAPVEIEFLGDDPFCNERREHRAGLHEHDASLAPSHYSPLGVK